MSREVVGENASDFVEGGTTSPTRVEGEDTARMGSAGDHHCDSLLTGLLENLQQGGINPVDFKVDAIGAPDLEPLIPLDLGITAG